MNMTRNGKIARLPKAVRDELNRRLADGEHGKRLVAWLNALPEVQALVATAFGGKPIREQNLSEWKQGGYRDWVAQQEALDLAQRLSQDAVELQAEGRQPLADALALWLAARYAVATRTLADQAGPEQWRQLRELCADVVELRRGDHSAERLRLERDRLKLERQEGEAARERQFWKWARQSENQDRICWVEKLSDKEKGRRMREIFGLDSDRAAARLQSDGQSADGPPASEEGQPCWTLPEEPRCT